MRRSIPFGAGGSRPGTLSAGDSIAGVPKPVTLEVPQEGTRILYRDHHYDLTLALARLGMLPFFWIACLAMYWWASAISAPP